MGGSGLVDSGLGDSGLTDTGMRDSCLEESGLINSGFGIFGLSSSRLQCYKIHHYHNNLSCFFLRNI